MTSSHEHSREKGPSGQGRGTNPGASSLIPHPSSLDHPGTYGVTPRPRKRPAPGLVYLVGAGPGDPGLLTVRGRELLAACDCLVYDALVSPEVLELANPDAERIYAGKRGGRHTLTQERINALLVEKARAGKTVVRLKGGDPYLFGRGAEEAQALADAGARWEVVPGVTAGLAAPAYAGIPVTHRRHASAVAFVTGQEDPAKPGSGLDWAALAKVGTLCLYMGVRNLGRLAQELARHLPASTPVAVIEWGTTPRQRTVTGTLADIEARVRAAGIGAPALTVVGAVVGLREKLSFFERRPLFGRRIVVTRARAQAGDLAHGLREQGAEVLCFPTIRIAPARDRRSLQTAVRHLDRFDWVVLTSANGVDAVFGELARQGRDARAFGAARLAVIGPATAARLAERGLRADLVPAKYVAEEIVAALKRAGAFKKRAPGVPRPRILLARAELARAALAEQLRDLGADVTEVVAYRTRLEKTGHAAARAALLAGVVDAVTFTSSSTARNFVALLGADALRTVLSHPRLKCFSIGPITSQTLRELGLPVHGEAAEYDLPGLLRLIAGAFSGGKVRG